MLPRRLVTVPVTAALLLCLGLSTPAAALVPAPTVAPPPVASVVVDSQEQGPDHSWRVTASWPESVGATGYTVSLTNNTGTATYRTRDVVDTTTRLDTDDLIEGRTYRVSVTAFTGDEEAAASSTTFEAMTLDRTAPTGTFLVAPTTVFLATDFFAFDEPTASASVTLRQLTLSDDTTPSSSISRAVIAGDGTAAAPWTADRFTITYHRAGTFTPKVRLTDAHGNTETVPLSPVVVKLDTTAPVVRVVRPPESSRDRISAWKRIYGSASDSGTGVEVVLTMVLQKRGSLWYAYDFGSRKWLRGKARERATLNRTKAMPAFATPDADGFWKTRRIRGMKTGKIAVHTAGIDSAGNGGLGRVVRQQITRR